MIIKCDICNYSANTQTKYKTHCKSQKHCEKVQRMAPPPSSALSSGIQRNEAERIADQNLMQIDIPETKLVSPLQCEYCMRVFARKDNVMRHVTICPVKKHKEQEKIVDSTIRVKELEHELEKTRMKAEYEKLELKLKHEQELKNTIVQKVDEIKGDKEFQQKMLACGSMNLDSALKVSMNAITYLNKYHTDTPPLKNFNDEFNDPFIVYAEGNVSYDGKYYIIDDAYIDKEQYIIDKILVLEENDDTVRFFAWLMEKIYKNEKYPHLQAYWAKDTTRNNYTVREIVGNDVKWFPDQDGRIIINKVITPLLNFTVSVVRKGVEKLAEEIEEKKKNKDIDCLVSILKKQSTLTGFINRVKRNQLQEEIIKKMAPAFHLDVSKQMAKRQLTLK
jgi:hypothetical protein